MADVFNLLKPKANLSRNAFDLSQRHLFSAKAGMILPVMALDCIPNDYHEINLSSLVRTMPVCTDAFARLRVRFVFGFVPYWHLWHPWNEFILQTLERQSNADPTGLPIQAPVVPLKELLGSLVSYAFSFAEDVHNETDAFGMSAAFNAVRMLDLLGYGNFYDLCYKVYHASAATRAQVYSDTLEYIDHQFPEQKVNLFRVAAYQKFCSDYFRNPIFDYVDPALFSLDSAQMAPIIDGITACNMFANIQYAYYQKDMFTGLYPTPQFGSVSSVDIVSKQIVNGAPVQGPGNSNAQINNAASAQPGVLRSLNSSAGFDKWSISEAFNVYDLKRAEAFQAWKETKLRAGHKLSDQAKAMWGTNFRYVMDNYSDFVGEVDLNLNIDEVLNQAQTDEFVLGQIGGKGIGVSSGKVTYKTDDFGVLLCCAIVEPVGEYNSVMLDKANTLCEPFDFASPQFENLGFEAVHQYQLNNIANPNATTATPDVYKKVIGYAPRYLMYKTAVDKCHGEFSGIGRGEAGTMSGSLSHWCMPRTQLQADSIQNPAGVNVDYYKIVPASVNSIFYQQASPFEDTDHFIFNCNFDIKSVRSLSVLGLPRW